MTIPANMPANMLGVRARSRRICKEIRDAVSVALKSECSSSNELGDFADTWVLDNGQRVSLCVEVLFDTARITQLSCEPGRGGAGTLVVNAIRDYAREHGLTLEVPDPFVESLPFWERFEWEQVGVDQIVLRMPT